MGERLEVILRAIDLTIAQVEAANGPDRDEQLATLFEMRERLLSQETEYSSKG
jgi:hypothetical protein